MNYVMVHHKIESYQKWKPIFDKESEFLKQSGCQRFGLYRDSNDPNDLVVFCEWDTIENAKKFFQSERLKKAMQLSGVIGEPRISFLNQLEKKSVTGETKATKVA